MSKKDEKTSLRSQQISWNGMKGDLGGDRGQGPLITRAWILGVFSKINSCCYFPVQLP